MARIAEQVTVAATSAGVAEVKLHIGRRARGRGRRVLPEDLAEVDAALGAARREPQFLIENLHLVQDRYGALRPRHLAALAKRMGIPMAQVQEVASFYHHFEMLPVDEAEAPAVIVRVCSGLSCQLRGAREVLDRAADALQGAGVKVVPTACIGRCDHAPAALVGQLALESCDADGVVDAVDSRRATCWRPWPADVAPLAKGYAAYRREGGYSTSAALVNGESDVEAVLVDVESIGLRGLGGAGFPAFRKWRAVQAQSAPRYLVANVDEGEPGTFKDRHYLERDPHRFLEGMFIAAQVVGAEACYVYIRDEYHECRMLLERELALLREEPPHPLPHIELRRGAGAYICGEESALIESLEGRRGEPRLRPPLVAQVGLFGRPTLEHNFETLYWLRDILERPSGSPFEGGPRAYLALGRRGRSGLRSYSVSGRVRDPGVKLAPAGISVRELIDEYCGGMADGHQLYAYLPGGASGGILPARLADIPLDFDTLQPYGCFIGSAAVVVLSEVDSAREAALNVMEFLADESCGQCTPCRVGTRKSLSLMREKVWNQNLLKDLCGVMADGSICGLGQAAPNPIRCVLQYFPHEVGLGEEATMSGDSA